MYFRFAKKARVLVLQTNGSGVLSFATPSSGVNTPAFCASASSDQNIGDSTVTLLAFDTEVFDSGNCYTNTATNYKFTPNVAGKYFFNINATFRESAEDFSKIDRALIFLYKNGGSIFRIYWDFRSSPVRYCNLSLSCITDANGTTDYFQAFGFIDVNSANQGTMASSSSDPLSFWSAFRIIGA